MTIARSVVSVRPAPGGRRGRGMMGGVVYDASGDA
jgi:hypothetical protein